MNLTPDRYPDCAGTCELLDQQVTRTERCIVALRKLASALHRLHRLRPDSTWPNCHEHFCLVAHDAIEGRLRKGDPNASGQIVSQVFSDDMEAP
jgi:hypothetical protein